MEIGRQIMTLKDISNGPEWSLWVVMVLLAVFSIVLLSGHGVNLIAGYNTASEEEKEQYDAKKLCRVIGVGMLVITVMIMIMALWEDVLPAAFAYIFLGVVITDCVVMIILANTICKK